MKTLTELIMVTSYSYPTHEEAEDSLHGCASMPGYVFGFVGQTGNNQFRTISFHVDAYPANAEMLPRSLARVKTILGE